MSGNIQMVDLKSQYLNIKEDIDQAIFSVLNSTSFIKGSDVSGFESNLKDYLNVRNVISCANGTDALQIALMAMDFQPGDEIITPSFTFVATAEVIALLKLKPIFVDVDPEHFTIDVTRLEAVISSKTKAIIPVHLFGQCANMNKIVAFARKYNLIIIEDTAQALGSDYVFPDGKRQSAGTVGHIGTTSFFPSKNLGCYGDGGAIFTNDDIIAEKIRSISNHGMKIRYYHDLIGVNSRLDTIQAAVLNVKLKYLDQYNKSRQTAALYYDEGLKQCKFLSIPKRTEYSTHIFHQYTLVLEKDENKQMVEHLMKFNIPAMIYYPVPIHLQKAYESYGYKIGDLPVTEKLCKRVFSIPMHTELTTEQQNIIIENVLNYFK